MSLNWLKIAVVSALFFYSCGEKSDEEVVEDQTGNLAEGSFLANSDEAQALTADLPGDLNGASIVFPAGSLSIDTAISIGEGASIANETLTDELGITDNGISKAGPAVVFSSSEDFNSAENIPFELSLPLSTPTGLALANCANPFVIYKQKRKVEDSEDVKLFIGIFKDDEVTLDNDFVKIATRYFGAYQPACADSKIEKVVKPKETTSPIVQKIPSLLHIGTWKSNCRDRSEERTEGDETITIEESEITVLSLTPKKFTYMQTEFESKDCKRPRTKTIINGVYKFVGDSSVAENTKEMDVKFERVFVRTMSEDSISYFNSEKFCGKDDWSSDTLVEIKNGICDGYIAQHDDAAGREIKTLIQIDGDEMRLGDDGDNQKGDENEDSEPEERDPDKRDSILEEDPFKRL